jgi:Na+/H+-dicarboxylate symporter
MAPVGVFALVLPLAVHAGGALVGAIGFYVLTYSVASVAVILLLYPVVWLVAHIPMRQFGSAALPAQLIAFSSSSSIAALPALIEGAEKRLGLPNRVTGFVLPLAVSTFKIASPVAWSIGAVFAGWFYGIELHLGDFAIIGFAFPLLCRAWYSTRRLYHVDAIVSYNRSSRRKHWYTHRGGRDSRHFRDRS